MYVDSRKTRNAPKQPFECLRCSHADLSAERGRNRVYCESPLRDLNMFPECCATTIKIQDLVHDVNTRPEQTIIRAVTRKRQSSMLVSNSGNAACS